MKAMTDARAKLKSRAGTSLAEMLFCVFLLLLVSAGMTAGIALAAGQYRDQRELSNAKLLYSTLSDAVTAELRYTGTVVVADPNADTTPLLEFYSRSYSRQDGLSAFAAVDDDGYSTTYGYLMLGDRSTGVSSVFDGLALISRASYADGLLAGIDVVCHPAAGSFTVTLTVGSSAGDTLVSGNFDVDAANHLTISSS